FPENVRGNGLSFNAPSLRDIRKRHIRSHSRAQFAFAVIESHFDAEYLFDAFADGLDISRRKFGFSRDLFDGALVVFVGLGIDANLNGFTELDVTKPRFWNIDANPQMLGEQKGRDFPIRREDVADFNAEHFNDAVRGRDDFHLAKLGVDFSELS